MAPVRIFPINESVVAGLWNIGVYRRSQSLSVDREINIT
jgi:hypothetical protein